MQVLVLQIYQAAGKGRRTTCPQPSDLCPSTLLFALGPEALKLFVARRQPSWPTWTWRWKGRSASPTPLERNPEPLGDASVNYIITVTRTGGSVPLRTTGAV